MKSDISWQNCYLKRMQESGLISEEEREKIAVLNIETFSPELAKVYL